MLTPNGHWTSYAPHKHDVEDPPHEMYLEYSEARSLEETLALRDGGGVLVPKGCHVVPAAGLRSLQPLLPQRHGRAEAGVMLKERRGSRTADAVAAERSGDG